MNMRPILRRARWVALLLSVVALSSLATGCDAEVGVGVGVYYPGPYTGRYPGSMPVPGGPLGPGIGF